MTYISAAFIMLMSSIMGRLSYFKYLLLLFSISLGIAAFLKIRKERRPLKDLMKAFGPSFVLFTLFFFYLYFVMQTKALSQVDDTARWAAKVEEALRLDCLYARGVYTFIKADYYPPFTTLNEIFFNKMLGGYSDSSSLFANASLCFALLLPFTDGLEWKKKDALRMITGLFTAILVLSSINHNPTMNGYVFLFNTTYPDWISGILTGAAFMEIANFKNRFSDYLYFGFLNGALLQTDRICFAFSLLICVTLAVRLAVLKEADKKSLGRYLIYCILIPLALYFIWRAYLNSFVPGMLFHLALPNETFIKAGGISGNGLFGPSSLMNSGIFAFKLNDTQLAIFHEFIKRIFTEPIYTRPFGISYFAFNCMVSGVLIVLRHFNKTEKQLTVVSLFYFLGSLAYAGVLCYAYMFMFPYAEAVSLAVYGRYLQCYTLAGIVVLFYGLLTYVRHDAVCLAVLALGILFLEPLSIETLIPTPDKTPYRQNEKTLIRNYAEHEYNGEPTIVVNSWDISYFYVIRNAYGEKSAGLISFRNSEDHGLEEFADLCRKCDYILIGDYDDDFHDNYWSRLSDNACYNSTLYRIIHDGDDFRFEMVYGFEAMAKGSGQ